MALGKLVMGATVQRVRPSLGKEAGREITQYRDIMEDTCFMYHIRSIGKTQSPRLKNFP